MRGRWVHSNKGKRDFKLRSKGLTVSQNWLMVCCKYRDKINKDKYILIYFVTLAKWMKTALLLLQQTLVIFPL